MKNKKYWWENAIFYELYIDKFAGNFRALSEKLPYLQELGVDCVHLLPFYPSPMVDGGYDVSDYQNIRPELGNLKDFDAFTKKAHEIGVKIMIDLVLNHTSINHPWFKEAAENKKSDKKNYYLWSKTGKEFSDTTNAFPHAKQKSWIFNKAAKEYYFSTFYPEQADLNWDNPKVFEETAKIMDFWVSLGVNVFRLDAVAHLIKREGTKSKNLPETHNVIKKIKLRAEKNYPGVALLGEVHDTLKKMTEYFGDGDECHFLYHFPLAESLIFEAVTGKKSVSAEYLQNLKKIPKNSSWLVFLRNHDDLSLATLTEEEWELFFKTIDPQKRFLFGEGIALRLKNLCAKSRKGSDRCLREITEKLFSIPAPIVLYYGDEIGMENLPFTGKERDVRAYARGNFDWIEAKRQSEDPRSLLSFIKELAAKRKH